MEELSTPAFDFGSIDLEAEADQGANMEVLLPRDDKASGKKRGDPIGITMHVLGEDSPTFRRNVREMVDEVQRNLEKEPTERDTAAKLAKARTAACALTGWTGTVVLNGEGLEFSRENAVRLFYERPWVAVQVENYRTNTGNFGPR